MRERGTPFGPIGIRRGLQRSAQKIMGGFVVRSGGCVHSDSVTIIAFSGKIDGDKI